MQPLFTTTRTSIRVLSRSSRPRAVSRSPLIFTQAPHCPRPVINVPRRNASHSTADEAIEEIQDQYATAKDEFEIAQEETEKMTVYAEDDRRAAKEELEKLQAMFKAATEQTAFGDEVRNRVGQRIRELENAVKHMEELAMNQD